MQYFIVRSIEDGPRNFTIHLPVLHPRWEEWVAWTNSIEAESIESEFPRHYVGLSVEDEAEMYRRFRDCIAESWEEARKLNALHIDSHSVN